MLLRNIRLVRYGRIADKVIGRANDLAGSSIETVRSVFKNIPTSHKNDKEKLIEALACAVRIIADESILNISVYKVQIIGALALFDDFFIEMKTGEGKTLTCVMATIAHSVFGRPVHIATANDYLAQRDANEMSKVYEALGISCSALLELSLNGYRKQAYACDVVYATAKTLAFDFLRDATRDDMEKLVQPHLGDVVVIVDEVDFILIDEAKTGIILSQDDFLVSECTVGMAHKKASSLIFGQASSPQENPNANILLDKKNYAINVKSGSEGLIDEMVRELILEQNPSASQEEIESGYPWATRELMNAIKAIHFFKSGEDYIVREGKVVIVDQHTGRIDASRKWDDGIHQAIEAKEGLELTRENSPVATTSMPCFFSKYKSLSGLSGTVMREAQEFKEVYKKKCLSIPSNKPSIRKDLEDKIFHTKSDKYKAIIDEVVARVGAGSCQPILLGTASVEESAIISQMLTSNRIKHSLLNATNDENESLVVAMAGLPYSITVATNMAGRGTDIILGGNEGLISAVFAKHGNDLLAVMDEHKVARGDARYRTEYLSQKDMIEKFREFVLSLDKAIPPIIESDAAGFEECMEMMYWDGCLVDFKEMMNKNHHVWRNEAISAGGLYMIGCSRSNSRRIDDQLRGRSGRQGEPGVTIFYLSLEDSWVQVFGADAKGLSGLIAKSMSGHVSVEMPILTKMLDKTQKAIETNNFNIRRDSYPYDVVISELFEIYRGVRRKVLVDKGGQSLVGFCFGGKDELCHDEYQTIEFIESPNFEKSEEFQVIKTELLLSLNTLWKNILIEMGEVRKSVRFQVYVQKTPIIEFRRIGFDLLSRRLDQLAQDVAVLIREKREANISKP